MTVIPLVFFLSEKFQPMQWALCLFLLICVCVHVCRAFGAHFNMLQRIVIISPIFATGYTGYRKHNVTHFHLFYSPVKLKQEERRQPNLQLWNTIIIFKVVCVYGVYTLCTAHWHIQSVEHRYDELDAIIFKRKTFISSRLSLHFRYDTFYNDIWYNRRIPLFMLFL